MGVIPNEPKSKGLQPTELRPQLKEPKSMRS